MSRARAAITSGIVALALVGAWFVGRGDVASVDESPAGDREAPGAIDPARPEAALAGHGRAKPAVGAPAARRVLGTPKPVEGASIRGIVVDGAGVAVAGARVVAIPDTATRFLAMEAVGAEGGTGAENFTDAQGRFVVAAVGDAPLYALVAQADGYGLVSVPDVPVGADVSVTLVAARRLHGRVLTIDGEPIAGAEVAVRVTVRHVVVERATTSAADGAYALDGLPADADPFGRFVDVRAVKAGFAPLQVRSLGRADPHDPDAFEQHLVLVRGATVVGVVVDDETGRPVPDARVVVWAPARVRALERRGGFLDEDPFGGVVLGTTATAPDGTFRLPHLPATGFHPVPWTDGRRGRVLGYVAARRAETTWGLAEVPVPADGATVEIEVRVRPAASVVGRVVDAAGRAVAGVRVHAFPEGRERDSALCPPEAAADGGAAASTTDADGGYRLPIVPASAKGPAPLTVVAQRPDVPGPRHGDVVVEVEAGRTARAPDLVVVGPSEPAAAHVVVRVLDANGGALAGATAVADGDPGAAFRAPRSGRDGRVRVALPRRATPDAALSLVVRAPAHGPATLHVPTDAADGATFDVTLTRGHVVAGRVRFADGRPAALAWVWAYDATDSVGDFLDRVDSAPSGGARTPPPRALSLVPTDADGRFRFDDLPAGAFHLTAHAPETRADGPPPAVVRTVPTGTTDVDLRFAPVEATAGPVTLRVVDAATGRPIVAATVVFEPAAPPADAPEAHDAPALYRFVDGQFVPRTTAPTPAPRAPGDFVTSGGRPGPYDVVVRAPGYLATRLGGVSVGPEGATLPTVRLSRGVHVHGRVAWPEGDAGVDRVVTFVRDDDGDDAPIVAPVIDGAFDASGFRPGRYRVRSDPPPGRRGRPVPLLRADDARVVVPPARDEVVADLAFVAAGTLRVRCGDPRLPPADWTGGKASAAQAEVGRRSAVTITTSAGAVVHRIAPLPRGVPLDEGTLLVLPGDYVVRLEGPDDVGAERRVTVGAGAWVDVELGRPANR